MSDYDFENVYKKDKINTNADALSRIKIDSDILKNMIPIEDDTSKSPKILAITRGMKAKDNIDNLHEKDVIQRNINNTNIWECSSLQEIKNVHKLRFIINTGMNKNDNGSNIHNLNNSFHMHISEDLAKYVLSLEKLISYMFKQNIKDLALASDDQIFKLISVDYLKRVFNEVYQRMKKIKKYKNLKLNIIIYKPLQCIKNKNKQAQLIKEFHDSPLAGHLGIRKTVLRLKQRYVWKNMRKMVRDYIMNCDKCLRNKQTKHIKEEMNITETPTSSFETIEIDTVGPLRISNSYRYILTMQCELTKYVVAYPIETKEAHVIAKTLVEQFILKYGCFKVLKSDNGTEFKNELMNEICKLLKIDQKFSAPYHHQSIGTLERNHRVMNEYMLNFVDDLEWDKWIPYYTFAYNTTPHVSNNYSPFELVYGKLPTLPTDKLCTKNKIYNLDNYANELKIRLSRALHNARHFIELAKQKSKNEYDKTMNSSSFCVGDLVLVRLESRKKNQSPYIGPFEIIKVQGVNSILKVKDKEKLYHNNSLKLYKTNL